MREIIDHTVFVGLQDIGRAMPEFEEIPVPISMDPDMALHYHRAKDRLGAYLFQCRMEGDASFLGKYLQTLLSWPTAPFRAEKIIHKRRFDRESDVFLEIPVHDMPGLGDDRLYPKEQWLLDLIRDELAQGRSVGVFLRQTGTRDIQPRIERLIREHVPNAKPFILKGSVAPERRESLVRQQLETGVNVLITNPRLVATGLDLVDFPTLVFHEIDYSLFTVVQASRRAWRIIQDRPCRVYYPFYAETMENQAVNLIGRKQQAANLLYGDTTGGGLSDLTGAESGGDLLAELAKAIDRDESVTDLRDLFARHAQQADPTESAWFVAEPELEPLYAAESGDDLVRFGVEELGGVVVEATESIEQAEKHPAPRPAALPPRKKTRRRKVSLFDVPESGEQPIQVPNWPTRQPEPVTVKPTPEVRQLALF